MALDKFTIRRRTASNFQIKVKNTSGVLQNQSPITIKGMGHGVKSIEDIGDVSEVSVEEGAVPVYTPSNDKYEIKKLDADDLDGDFNLDCGEF